MLSTIERNEKQNKKAEFPVTFREDRGTGNMLSKGSCLNYFVLVWKNLNWLACNIPRLAQQLKTGLGQ